LAAEGPALLGPGSDASRRYCGENTTTTGSDGGMAGGLKGIAQKGATISYEHWTVTHLEKRGPLG